MSPSRKRTRYHHTSICHQVSDPAEECGQASGGFSLSRVAERGPDLQARGPPRPRLRNRPVRVGPLPSALHRRPGFCAQLPPDGQSSTCSLKPGPIPAKRWTATPRFLPNTPQKSHLPSGRGRERPANGACTNHTFYSPESGALTLSLADPAGTAPPGDSQLLERVSHQPSACLSPHSTPSRVASHPGP